jgi:hypothetical protein
VRQQLLFTMSQGLPTHALLNHGPVSARFLCFYTGSAALTPRRPLPSPLPLPPLPPPPPLLLCMLQHMYPSRVLHTCMSITSIILQPALFFWGHCSSGATVLLGPLFFWGHKFWPNALSRLRWGYGTAAGVLLMKPLVRVPPAVCFSIYNSRIDAWWYGAALGLRHCCWSAAHEASGEELFTNTQCCLLSFRYKTRMGARRHSCGVWIRRWSTQQLLLYMLRGANIDLVMSACSCHGVAITQLAIYCVPSSVQ